MASCLAQGLQKAQAESQQLRTELTALQGAHEGAQKDPQSAAQGDAEAEGKPAVPVQEQRGVNGSRDLHQAPASAGESPVNMQRQSCCCFKPLAGPSISIAQK